MSGKCELSHVFSSCPLISTIIFASKFTGIARVSVEQHNKINLCRQEADINVIKLVVIALFLREWFSLLGVHPVYPIF